MGTFGRDETEAMVAKYKGVSLRAGVSGDWTEWANCFTEDATYIDHCMSFETTAPRSARSLVQ